MRKSDIKYRITLLNWDKYQPKMRGTGKRKRMRNWVAISTDLFRDPDFLELSHSTARLWLGLLLHGGRVGPEFSLTPARAVSLFSLRRPCDFDALVNHGFIELKRVYITGQDEKHTTDRTETQPAAQVVANRKKKKAVKKAANEIKGLNQDAWKKWIAHRTETNKPPYTTNGIATKLAKLPHDNQMDCVDSSIDMAYTGLFPDKFSGNGNETNNQRSDNSFDAMRARLAKRAGLD